MNLPSPLEGEGVAVRREWGVKETTSKKPHTHFSNAHNFALKNFPLPQGARVVNKTVTAFSPFTSHVSRKRAAFTLAEVFSPHFKDNRKIAFTLAEVLITLGIIGVVAAMTLPTLITKNQEKVTVNRLKKTYSVLSQAYLMISKDYGAPTNWGISATRDADGNPTPEGSINTANLFAKYMKITKNCGNAEGCWHPGSSYQLNGQIYADTNSRQDISKIKLADGTHVAFGGLDGECAINRGATKALSSVCSWIIVDVNGNERPNTYGIDIFEFSLTKYNILPYGIQEETLFSFERFCKNSSTASGNGCTAWVLYNENMDYRKCNDLSWDGKTKCN